MTDCKLLLKANAERGGNKKEHCDGMIREAITLIDELVSVSEKKNNVRIIAYFRYMLQYRK